MKKYIVCVEVKSHDMWEIEADNEDSAKLIVMGKYDQKLEADVSVPVNRKILEIVEKNA